MTKILVTTTKQTYVDFTVILNRKDKAIKQQIAVKSQEIREEAEWIYASIVQQFTDLMETDAAKENVKQRSDNRMTRHHFASVMATMLINQYLAPNHFIENQEIINHEVAYDMFYKMSLK